MKGFCYAKNVCIVCGVMLLSVCMSNARATAQIYDDFNDDTIDQARWTVEEESDATVIETAGRLDLSLLPTAAGDLFGINTSANCFIFGDFDIRVDFSLTSWPVANGVRTSLTVNSRDTRLGIERSAWGPDTGWTDTEYYIMNGNSMRKGYTPTSDLDGKLRLQRIGNEITGYVFQENTGWEMLASYTMDELDMDPAEPVFFSLNAWSHDEFFNPGGQTVTVSFDNMDVTGESLFYPNKQYRQFAYAVDFFAIQGNVQGGAFLDEFNDGILWENVAGNVMELDGFLLLQDPGQMEMFFADDHVVFEQYSGISTSVDEFAIENGRGDFAARTKWHVPRIDSDTLSLFNLSFRDMSGTGGKFQDITAGIYDFGSVLSVALEVPEGLNAFFLYENERTGTFHIQTIPVDPADINADVILELSFDDDIDLFTAAYSLDNGTTAQTIGSPVYMDLTDAVFESWEIEAIVFDKEWICRDIFDGDGDIDGRDLFLFLDNDMGVTLQAFAENFGRTVCPWLEGDFLINH